jgi:hypothetical protein
MISMGRLKKVVDISLSTSRMEFEILLPMPIWPQFSAEGTSK